MVVSYIHHEGEHISLICLTNDILRHNNKSCKKQAIIWIYKFLSPLESPSKLTIFHKDTRQGGGMKSQLLTNSGPMMH